ncbi:hypothetical protein AVEN_210486-1 [Araneus ventricosus]|uniref:Uncharacterized protein n=1 Tax=Araneus ventricosus TaxID=182803 RepID=A0A4Y2V122_ARAVE|nr:hypothetical protein AVEN_210486-1 [Araneus ventricosus]
MEKWHKHWKLMQHRIDSVQKQVQFEHFLPGLIFDILIWLEICESGLAAGQGTSDASFPHSIRIKGVRFRAPDVPFPVTPSSCRAFQSGKNASPATADAIRNQFHSSFSLKSKRHTHRNTDVATRNQGCHIGLFKAKLWRFGLFSKPLALGIFLWP